MRAPPEPKRDRDINHLQPYLIPRVLAILNAMKARGFDAMPFETLRSQARQNYLYGIGRRYLLTRKPVTFLDGVHKFSMHQKGKAVDVVSQSQLWNAPTSFWSALKSEAAKVGLHSLGFEKCHVEWRG